MAIFLHITACFAEYKLLSNDAALFQSRYTGQLFVKRCIIIMVTYVNNRPHTACFIFMPLNEYASFDLVKKIRLPVVWFNPLFPHDDILMIDGDTSWQSGSQPLRQKPINIGIALIDFE